MPFALLIIGAVLLISAARGTVQTGPNGGPGLFTLLESDFTGQDNFIFWFVAILIIGAVGYIQKLRPFSVALLALVIIVLFLKKGAGFLPQLASAIGTTQNATPSGAGPGTTSALLSLLNSATPSQAVTSPVVNPTGAGAGTTSGLLSILTASEPSTALPAPVPSINNTSIASTGFGSSLLPVSSGTDLSFPSLGIG
jgi:hypothetical protein